MLVHEFTESMYIATLEQASDLQADLLGEVQAFEHTRVALLGSLLLLLQQVGGGTRVTDKEQHQRVSQFQNGFLTHAQRRDDNAVVGPIVLARQSSIGGNVMVLLADGHSEAVHLYVKRLTSQRFGRHGPAFV